jgi:hypothetical protein
LSFYSFLTKFWLEIDSFRQMSSVGGVQTDLAASPASVAASGPGVVGLLVELGDAHGVRRFAPTRSSGTVKRVFDLLGASLGLLVAMPLLAVIAVAIKLDSRGPVFFRQLRVGRDGKGFYMLKFRTMVPDAEALKDSLRHRNEAREGLFKSPMTLASPGWGASCAAARWMSCLSC